MELRESLMTYLKSKLPHVPPYVLKDFMYPTLKTASKEQIGEFIQEYGSFKWELEKDFKVHPEILTDFTNKQLIKRAGGTKNPNQVPNDELRHQNQKELIAKKGLPTQPLIFVYENGKYDLLEGWHRTIQLFNLYPDGFEYPNVYIGYPPEDSSRNPNWV